MMCTHTIAFAAGIGFGLLVAYLVRRRRYKRFKGIQLSHSMEFIPTEWEDSDGGRKYKSVVVTGISTVPKEDQ